MTNRKALIAAALVLSGFINAAVAQNAPEEPAPFTLSVTCNVKTVTVGENVRILVTLTNSSERNIVMAQDVSHKAELQYVVSVFDAQNKPTQKTKYHKALTGEVEAFVNIAPMQFPLHPGDKLTDYADLSKLFDLGKPGKYLISVERINPYSKDAKGVVKSNTVVLTVTE